MYSEDCAICQKTCKKRYMAFCMTSKRKVYDLDRERMEVKKDGNYVVVCEDCAKKIMYQKKKTNIILFTILGIIGAIVGALILVNDFKSYWVSFGEVPASDIGYIILFAIFGALIFMLFGLKIEEKINNNRKWEVMQELNSNW